MDTYSMGVKHDVHKHTNNHISKTSNKSDKYKDTKGS